MRRKLSIGVGVLVLLGITVLIGVGTERPVVAGDCSEELRIAREIISQLNGSRLMTDYNYGAHWDGYTHEHQMQNAITSYMNTWHSLVPKMERIGLTVKDPGHHDIRGKH